jgi:hypothetical protein
MSDAMTRINDNHASLVADVNDRWKQIYDPRNDPSGFFVKKFIEKGE